MSGVADEAGPVRGLTADLRATDSALTFDARFTFGRGNVDVLMVKSQTAFLKKGPSPRARELLASLGIDPNEMKRAAEGLGKRFSAEERIKRLEDAVSQLQRDAKPVERRGERQGEGPDRKVDGDDRKPSGPDGNAPRPSGP